MGRNVFSERSVRRLSMLTGLDVLWASVGSEGRFADLTVKTESGHRHVEYDRVSGDLTDQECHRMTSCRIRPWERPYAHR